MPPRKTAGQPALGKAAKPYQHRTADSLMRPEVGTEAQFKKRKAPKKYRYDDSLDPALSWDGQNSSRALGEWLLSLISEASKLPAPHRFPQPKEFIGGDGAVLLSVQGLQDAVERLKSIEKPFLNWAGKAERLSFDVPTLPLFIHERLSTKAILETLKGHKRDKQADMFDLFGDPQRSITDQVLRAYEHRDKWVNRMILGDSLVVMNSLLCYEGLGGQVQMIYIDPPYGVKFGSNFQPFVRKRDVVHNDDEDMTREPEMVQAYRDTWELGLHSYLTYLRDRLLLARELLTPSGSIFVQISDENVHHVREVMDDVFETDNFVVSLVIKKKSATTTTDPVNDFVLWYARDRETLRPQRIFEAKSITDPDSRFNKVLFPDGSVKVVDDCAVDEIQQRGGRLFNDDYPLVSQDEQQGRSGPFVFEGQPLYPGKNRHWTFDPDTGMTRLAVAGRLRVAKNTARGVVFLDDFAYSPIPNIWEFHGERNPVYVVQTNRRIIERCMLMTTDPGDLVLDPTCGSGTSAYVAEQWGRRWITLDTSRVPLALARQRLLTATFDWYELKDESSGPVAGLVYKQKQNRKGEEIGGIVPHVTLKSIANNGPPQEEVLVDRPEIQSGVTRVTGPFTLEATIPTPQDFEAAKSENSPAQGDVRNSSVDRMVEILRKSPVLRLEGNRTVTLKSVRPAAKTLSLSAEAMVTNGTERPVAFVFGPENGGVSERLVYAAAKEANAKSYAHLYVIGFAIQPNARMLVEQSNDVVGIPATYVQATPDLMMGDLLKNMRSSQIFSVCGMPEAKLRKAQTSNGPQPYEVELLGMDVFDPVSMEVQHRTGEDVPAWFLDTNYNGLCFHVSQAFFPRTKAWESLKNALKGEYEDAVWDHLAGTVSAPFEAGEHGQIAVKVIDDRGNELLIVKKLSEVGQ
jgi:adenine-specific DNA-methyltransferase